jgi:hypothetical protein
MTSAISNSRLIGDHVNTMVVNQKLAKEVGGERTACSVLARYLQELLKIPNLLPIAPRRSANAVQALCRAIPD